MPGHVLEHLGRTQDRPLFDDFLRHGALARRIPGADRFVVAALHLDRRQHRRFLRVARQYRKRQHDGKRAQAQWIWSGPEYSLPRHAVRMRIHDTLPLDSLKQAMARQDRGIAATGRHGARREPGSLPDQARVIAVRAGVAGATAADRAGSDGDEDGRRGGRSSRPRVRVCRSGSGRGAGASRLAGNCGEGPVAGRAASMAPDHPDVVSSFNAKSPGKAWSSIVTTLGSPGW